MRRVTFSRNFTVSLSRTCQCYCKYCAFATHQAHLYAPDEVEKMLDDAFAGKELPEPACKTDAVDETIRLAGRLKIEGTPTMILPDGRQISGYMAAEALLSLLDGGR